MAKSIKLQNNTYWGSKGIVYSNGRSTKSNDKCIIDSKTK